MVPVLVIAKLAKEKISDYIDKIKIKIKIVDKCEECEEYILIAQKKFYLISIMKILNTSVFKTEKLPIARYFSLHMFHL